MQPITKADTIIKLKKEILSLQGFKSSINNFQEEIITGPIKDAFPQVEFPLGVIHEFVCSDREDTSATIGFISGLLKTMMKSNGVVVWITSTSSVFPPALKSFGIDPSNIIFIYPKSEKEILWATEEALKCDGLAAVIADIKELSFLNSRRLQLAVEQSRVTGFILRQDFRKINITASVARWKISSLLSALPDDMPGVGFPRWNVELLKIRNGKLGSWQIEWAEEKFRYIFKTVSLYREQQKKTG